MLSYNSIKQSDRVNIWPMAIAGQVLFNGLNGGTAFSSIIICFAYKFIMYCADIGINLAPIRGEASPNKKPASYSLNGF